MTALETSTPVTSYQGQVLQFQVAFVDSAGDPVTITAARCSIFPHKRARRSYMSFTHNDSELVIQNINGTDDGFELTLTRGQMEAVPPGRYRIESRAAGSYEAVGQVGYLHIEPSGARYLPAI